MERLSRVCTSIYRVSVPLVLLTVAARAVDWSKQAVRDSARDRKVVIFEGASPNKLACDTMVRKMPDGSWLFVMLGGGDREPLPQNQIFTSRSLNEGHSWSPLLPLRIALPTQDRGGALVPSELMVHQGRSTLFFATHDGSFGDWTSWYTVSPDSGRTWGVAQPLPGDLHRSTFVRNHILGRDGSLILPFQHYLALKGPVDPRNGVLISKDGGKTFESYGSIRVTDNDKYSGWTENALAQLHDGSLAMLIRADRLGGVLYRADSQDGGKTWSAAYRTDIPNPGSKITLYALGGDRFALLHNPDAKVRNPLALWISFDGLRTWGYRRVLWSVTPPPDGSKGASISGVNYPDGFLSQDRRYLHFAFDEKRQRAIYYAARLPVR